MRKNAVALSIATLIGGLSFVGAASADVIVGTGVPGVATLGASNANGLVFASGGVGHILLTPYFNTQNGNATIFSLTNTDIVNGKIVKVRFRGASNSDDILDFTVLMSPGDVWNATVTAAAGAASQIVTNDRSCTLPQLAPGVPQGFVTTRLTTKGGSDINNNTREGYIEIFNMADVQPGSALFTTIKHVGGIPTCSSAVINAAILNTNYVAEAPAAAAGLAAPTTGLFGSWVLINVPQTTTYSGQMSAVRAVLVATGANATGNFVLFPQSATAYGPADFVTADPLLRTASAATKTAAGATGGVLATPVIAAAFFDMPDLSTPYVGPGGLATSPTDQANVLTAALAVNNVINEYANDAIVSAQTDWVFSMPTRRYSVAMDYSPATPRRLYSNVPTGAVPQYFHDGNTSINPLNVSQICVTAIAQTFYDREETTKTSGAVFSPGNISTTQFCGETSVLSFASTGLSVLGGSVARQDTGSSAFVNGWGNINVQQGGGGLGLPIIGAAFLKLTNPGVAVGQSGTYGITFGHRSR